MNPIKMTVSSTGIGNCALTGKETEGLTVAFENEQPTFLSWKALRQLVTMKAGQGRHVPAGLLAEPHLRLAGHGRPSSLPGKIPCIHSMHKAFLDH
jgi:hypothetical protein